MANRCRSFRSAPVSHSPAPGCRMKSLRGSTEFHRNHSCGHHECVGTSVSLPVAHPNSFRPGGLIASPTPRRCQAAGPRSHQLPVLLSAGSRRHRARAPRGQASQTIRYPLKLCCSASAGSGREHQADLSGRKRPSTDRRGRARQSRPPAAPPTASGAAFDVTGPSITLRLNVSQSRRKTSTASEATSASRNAAPAGVVCIALAFGDQQVVQAPRRDRTAEHRAPSTGHQRKRSRSAPSACAGAPSSCGALRSTRSRVRSLIPLQLSEHAHPHSRISPSTLMLHLIEPERHDTVSVSRLPEKAQSRLGQQAPRPCRRAHTTHLAPPLLGESPTRLHEIRREPGAISARSFVTTTRWSSFRGNRLELLGLSRSGPD